MFTCARSPQRRMRGQALILLLVALAAIGFESNAVAVGAVTPYVSIEAESGKLGGGGTMRYLTNAPTTQYSSAELEASGHAYVRLDATGEYAEWTNHTGQGVT